MASSVFPSTFPSPTTTSPYSSHRDPPRFPPLPTSLSFSFSVRPSSLKLRCRRQSPDRLAVRAQTFDFSASFFEDGFGGEDDESDSTFGPGGIDVAEEKEEIQCPPGLRQYETMAVLRPDMTEDERLALTQKYEELLVAGGGMYVEVFNRGVIPLAYSIKRKNRDGETNTYFDGIYLLFTYFTKPESMDTLETTLKTDDNVIRSSSFKIRKRRY